MCQKSLLQLDQEADVLFHRKATYKAKGKGTRRSISLGRVEESCVHAAAHQCARFPGRFLQERHKLAIRREQNASDLIEAGGGSETSFTDRSSESGAPVGGQEA